MDGKEALVEYDPNKTDVSKIIKAFNDAGRYKASEVS